MKKEEKEKLKAMSFKEKRAYYKSKRMGWRKAWHIIKWAFAGFGVFMLICLTIMIIQINTQTKPAVKADTKSHVVHKTEAKSTPKKTTTQDTNPAPTGYETMIIEKKVSGRWKLVVPETKIIDKGIISKDNPHELPAASGAGTYRDTFYIYKEDGTLQQKFSTDVYDN